MSSEIAVPRVVMGPPLLFSLVGGRLPLFGFHTARQMRIFFTDAIPRDGDA